MDQQVYKYTTTNNRITIKNPYLQALAEEEWNEESQDGDHGLELKG